VINGLHARYKQPAECRLHIVGDTSAWPNTKTQTSLHTAMYDSMVLAYSVCSGTHSQ